MTRKLYVVHCLECEKKVQYVPEKSEPNFKHFYSSFCYANYSFSVRKCKVNTKPCENCKA